MAANPTGSLHILAETESSNNYATGRIHAGLAKHGDGWLALHQTAGKGQRGKQWTSAPGENILLSVAINPDKGFHLYPFLLSAVVAVACRDFFTEFAGDPVKIKWPNDIYWRDRKAAGILIDTVYRGAEWQWAVIGIGMNINQEFFAGDASNAISLLSITGKRFDVVEMAEALRLKILNAVSVQGRSAAEVMNAYNDRLYKKGEVVKLRYGNAVFETAISHADASGQLHTMDAVPRSLAVGDVQWVG